MLYYLFDVAIRLGVFEVCPRFHQLPLTSASMISWFHWLQDEAGFRCAGKPLHMQWIQAISLVGSHASKSWSLHQESERWVKYVNAKVCSYARHCLCSLFGGRELALWLFHVFYYLFDVVIRFGVIEDCL